MNSSEDKVVLALERLGLALPEPTGTHFDYLPALLHEKKVFVAGQIPKITLDRLSVCGALGRAVAHDAAREATRLCVLHALAWIRSLAGSLDDSVARVLRVNYFFQVPEEGYGRMSDVADAGSQLLVAALGERGRHPRSVIGVRELPRDAPVLIDMDVALK